MKELFKKHFAKLLVFLLVGSVIYCNDKRKESDIEMNKETTIAKITNKGRKNRVSYTFRYDGKWISGNDSGNGKAQVGEYYGVHFDRTNPKNSDIILGEKSINPLTLIDQGVDIQGTVKKIGYRSNTYVDLYISYEYDKETFEFRTRKHVDSLPCGKVPDCENASITLKISDYFPELNHLYFESHDRSKLRRELKLKFE